MIIFDPNKDRIHDPGAQERYRVRNIELAQRDAHHIARTGDPKGIAAKILEGLRPMQRLSDRGK